jgi:phosphate transport system substrate-binding protein
MKNAFWRVGVLAGAVALLVTAGAAAGTSAPSAKAVSGTITADGSSTVGPFASAAAERFRRSNRGANITVGISGTGGGFERFCRGETDLSNASRPIRYSEAARCQQNNVRYIQFLVANDGISLAVSRENNWANCLTVPELKSIWDRGSRVSNWNQVRPSFPNVPIRLYGAGTDSGTFEFFTEAINGRARQSRSDYTASEDDNVLVNGVAGDRGGLAYFGYSYYVENRNRLKLLGVDSGSGCRTPSVDRIQNRQYKPLSRPLFIYPSENALQRVEVREFVQYYIDNYETISEQAKFVPMTSEQSDKSKQSFEQLTGGGGT